MLADYGKNPNLSFSFLHNKEKSFELRDICTLEIDKLALSLDCKYLLISCGLPEQKIIIVDVENKKLLKGSHSFIETYNKKPTRI